MALAVRAATSSPTPRKAAISSMDSSWQNVLSTSKQMASSERRVLRTCVLGSRLMLPGLDVTYIIKEGELMLLLMWVCMRDERGHATYFDQFVGQMP